MNSSLVTVIVPASVNNFTYGRDGKVIKKITIHHMAGIMSAEECGKLWQNPNRETSSHYGIGVNGEIGQYVDEENTSWCDSNWDSNCISVTIENSNDSTGGDWHVSDVTLNSLIKLCADISLRNNLGLLKVGENLTWHSMYAATTCPGDYLRSKMEYIAEESNKIITSGLKYEAHIEGIGWQGWKTNGETAGTTGESRRLEAIKIDAPFDVEAMAHLEDIGWVDYGKITKDSIIGTIGESRRLECLKLKGNFKYRVHIENSGWSTWTNADGICTLGSVGQSLRIEAIEMVEL